MKRLTLREILETTSYELHHFIEDSEVLVMFHRKTTDKRGYEVLMPELELRYFNYKYLQRVKLNVLGY